MNWLALTYDYLLLWLGVVIGTILWYDRTWEDWFAAVKAWGDLV